jgi:hypothetical protein
LLNIGAKLKRFSETGTIQFWLYGKKRRKKEFVNRRDGRRSKEHGARSKRPGSQKKPAGSSRAADWHD